MIADIAFDCDALQPQADKEADKEYVKAFVDF